MNFPLGLSLGTFPWNCPLEFPPGACHWTLSTGPSSPRLVCSTPFTESSSALKPHTHSRQQPTLPAIARVIPVRQEAAAVTLEGAQVDDGPQPLRPPLRQPLLEVRLSWLCWRGGLSAFRCAWLQQDPSGASLSLDSQTWAAINNILVLLHKLSRRRPQYRLSRRVVSHGAPCSHHASTSFCSISSEASK